MGPSDVGVGERSILGATLLQTCSAWLSLGQRPLQAGAMQLFTLSSCWPMESSPVTNPNALLAPLPFASGRVFKVGVSYVREGALDWAVSSMDDEWQLARVWGQAHFRWKNVL